MRGWPVSDVMSTGTYGLDVHLSKGFNVAVVTTMTKDHGASHGGVRIPRRARHLIKLLFTCQLAGLTAVPVMPSDPARYGIGGPTHAYLLRVVL